jgi:hypothetical protein
MNNDALDQILRDWLGEGPERGRVEALDRALAATHRTVQRRRWRQSSWPARRFAKMNTFTKLGMAVTAVVGIAVTGVTIAPRFGGAGTAQSTLSPGPSSVGKPSPSPNSQVLHVWTTNQSLAATIQRQDPTDSGRYYWRAVTYDQIGFDVWSQTSSTTIMREPDTQLLQGLADTVDPAGLHSFTFTVTPAEFDGPTILSPATPVKVKETTRLTYVGQTGYFAMLERDGGSGPYTVTALTQPPITARGQLGRAELQAAGTDYPEEVKALYLQVAPGSIGTNARKLEDKIRAEAASSAPFDLANQIVTELHSSTYTYVTDVRDLDCATVSTAECFATHKRGFCQYYAATMAVLLRDLGVPTRIVDGFLPGTVDRNGTETIPMSSAHTWVEVYFPGHGWVMFDPTGGLPQVEPLPSR